MYVQSIPDRTGQEAKFDNQIRQPAKSEDKRKLRTAGDSGRLAETDIGGVSRLEMYHETTKP